MEANGCYFPLSPLPSPLPPSPLRPSLQPSLHVCTLLMYLPTPGPASGTKKAPPDRCIINPRISLASLSLVPVGLFVACLLGRCISRNACPVVLGACSDWVLGT
mgnify:CR=1 FL=1